LDYATSKLHNGFKRPNSNKLPRQRGNRKKDKGPQAQLMGETGGYIKKTAPTRRTAGKFASTPVSPEGKKPETQGGRGERRLKWEGYTRGGTEKIGRRREG